MIKKFVYYGLIIVAIAIVIIFASGYVLTNGLYKSISAKNLTTGPDSFSYFPVSYNSSTQLAIYVLSNKPLNVYLLNSSTYLTWSAYALSNKSSNGLNYVDRLKVNSTDIFKNETYVVAPIIINNTNKTLKGIIYVVLDNTPGSTSSSKLVNSTIAYLPLGTSKLIVYGIFDVVAIILFVAGLIVLAYGLLKKEMIKDQSGKVVNAKDQKDKEYVDSLYKGVKKVKKGNSQ